MARILVLHSSWHGQATRIAQRMAQVLTSLGHIVTLRSALEPDCARDLGTYDGVIVGAAVHRGKHHGHLARLIRHCLPTLRARPTAFFSVSLSAAGTPRQREVATKMMDRFLDASGWCPDELATFAGALQYTRYPWPLKYMMRFIASMSGRDTDTSRDYEYTDWSAVERFAVRFGDLLPVRKAA
jgi:menaquinone-dependent protoporphyrinogen oxidase